MWDEFVELATSAFRFLETDFAFKLKSIKRPLITYESDKLRVDIYYDVDRRHELDLGSGNWMTTLTNLFRSVSEC